VWELSEPEDTLIFITAGDNKIFEVWKYPFSDSEQNLWR